MNKELQNSSFFRSQQMQSVNRNVLKLINQKKYPLQYQKLSKTRHSKDRYNLSKLQTCPSDTILSMSTSMLPCQKLPRKLQSNERSMGEYFQKQNTRHLNEPYRADKDLEEIGNKINNYLWERKKQIVRHSSSTDRQNQQEEYYLRQQNKSRLLRKNSLNNLPTVLRNMRKKMMHQFVKDSQAIELSMYKNQQKDKSKQQIEDNRISCDFLEGHDQMNQLMKKYPIKRCNELKKDLNKQMMKDMMDDLKQKQSSLSDKYSKIRIIINHKKIISMG